MLRLLKKFWDAICFAGLLVGLLYIPADLYGLTDTYPWLRRVTATVGRFDLLVGFSVLTVAYIIWADIRPLVRRWRESRQVLTIKVATSIYCECNAIGRPLDDGTCFYENRFHLVVGNNRPDGTSLRRVQCRVFLMGAPTLLLLKGSESDATDIRHGEWAFFEIGKIVSKTAIGLYTQSKESIEIMPRADYQHNVPQGFLTFEMRDAAGRNSGLGHRPEHPNTWKILTIISADDVLARQVQIEIDMADIKSPVTWKETR